MKTLFNQLAYARYWTTETWTFIVAAIALAQPWLINIYKKLLKRGKIEIYETGTPEIGFSGLGATIGLYGTLRAREREFFVHMAGLEVRKLPSSTSSRYFEWLAFRPLTNIVGKPNLEIEFTLPASFMINPLQPHQYNIVFSDQPVRDGIQVLLLKVRSKWTEFALASEKVNKLKNRTSDSKKLQALFIEIQHEVYQDFCVTTQYEELTKELLGLMPWTASVYEITLVVTSAQPNKSYRKSWLLDLTDEMIGNLRMNAAIVFESVCKDIFLQHNFAYPRSYPKTRGNIGLLRSKQPDLN